MPQSANFSFTSAVRAQESFTEESWDSFKQIFDVYMFEVSKVVPLICDLSDIVVKMKYPALTDSL